MVEEYSLTKDPIYYITVACFAMLTTSLPAVLGQPRFMPFAQAVALFIFMVIPLRRQNVKPAVYVLSLWLVLQYVLILMLTAFSVARIENAIPNGFAARGEILAWFFGAAPYPVGLAGNPVARIVELAGIVLGSALTAGLVGVWFLTRATNLAAFESGVLLNGLDSAGGYLLAILPWNLLRVAGYASLVLLFTQFLLLGITSSSRVLQENRRLVLIAGTLIVLALLGEWILPPLWQSLAGSLL